MTAHTRPGRAARFASGEADPAEVREQLAKMRSEDDAAAYVRDLDLNEAQLRQLADQISVPAYTRDTVADIQRRIVDVKVAEPLGHATGGYRAKATEATPEQLDAARDTLLADAVAYDPTVDWAAVAAELADAPDHDVVAWVDRNMGGWDNFTTTSADATSSMTDATGPAAPASATAQETAPVAGHPAVDLPIDLAEIEALRVTTHPTALPTAAPAVTDGPAPAPARSEAFATSTPAPATATSSAPW
jgi:hypothetical protein